jgi:branched-chain amino acid aminotransferase
MAKLGFDYVKVNCRFVMKYRNEMWNNGKLKSGDKIKLSQAANVLNYGQSCFEGLKAHRTRDNKIQMFRPFENIKRMNDSANRLLMPNIPEDKFVNGLVRLIQANKEFVPAYETGGSLYLRPLMIGTSANLAVIPSTEYLFTIYCNPVGGYFSGGSIKLITTTYDRAAGNGTGNVKVAGNYAGSLLPNYMAKKNGYNDCIYLDPLYHAFIEEVGAANFFGITNDNVLVTPKSSTILPSITRKSIIEIAKKLFNMRVEERPVHINELKYFKECFACGTAAVITPIGEITHKDVVYDYSKQNNEMTSKLYNTLVGIQKGDMPSLDDWIYQVC